MNHPASLRIMIVAGEASGDHHAAALVESLREASPQTKFDFFGMTGEHMREAGVRTIVAADDLAIVGLLEVGRALPRFLRVFRELKRAATNELPDTVVLVDYPEFNLPLARSLKKRGFRVIYFISPQLWAWRSYRVRRIKRDVDLLLTILPFEAAWYARRGFNRVEFIGHPLAGSVAAHGTRTEFCQAHDLNPARPLVALLPGSRHQEVTRHLPLMLAAASELRKTNIDAQFVVALAKNRNPDEIECALDLAFNNNSDLEASLRIAHGATYDALAAADAAAVASGTATLEAMLLETPMVVVYRESALNWHTLGKLINVEHFALPNLIADKRIATELIQRDFTPTRLAHELALLLQPERNRQARDELRCATSTIGDAQASERAAQAVLKALREWKQQGERGTMNAER